MQLQLPGPCNCRAHMGIICMAPLSFTPCAWSKHLSKGEPWLAAVLLPVISDPTDDHRAGRAEGGMLATSSALPSCSSSKEVNNTAFTIPCLYPGLHYFHKPSHTNPSFPQATPLCLQWEFEWKWSNYPDLGYSSGKNSLILVRVWLKPQLHSRKLFKA